ncbi:MAG: DUF3168 domain-containing protein [Hyphomonadaceae bacterium]|nr:DUF3168 domain-containing protein [Hyphomonadaceae bacterium]
MSAEAALLAALRGALLGDAAVQAALGDPARVYDDHPPDPVFPYATLGAIETRSADAAGVAGLEHLATFHVWSRYGGRAEALAAIDAARAALHDRALSVAGRRLVLLLATFADVFRAGDGRTTHGVLRVRAITEAA